MPDRPRILAVEDDRDLLELTGAILGQENDIVCEATTASALRRIAGERFDLLITDLNIEAAGDGLLLAGTMRYLQPEARTIMITGYPDFTRAVLAMQTTLDLVLLKPVEVDAIRKLPHEVVSQAARSLQEIGRTSLWLMLERKKTEILGAWLRLVEQDAELSHVVLKPAERLDHMDKILSELAARAGDPNSPEHEHAAQQHGHERHAQHYRAEWVAKEMSFLRRAIFDAILRELLHLDLSTLTSQLFDLNSALDLDLLRSLRAFGLLAA